MHSSDFPVLICELPNVGSFRRYLGSRCQALVATAHRSKLLGRPALSDRVPNCLLAPLPISHWTMKTASAIPAPSTRPSQLFQRSVGAALLLLLLWQHSPRPTFRVSPSRALCSGSNADKGTPCDHSGISRTPFKQPLPGHIQKMDPTV